jgi:D-serine deaminase-like pyridoxal phosphate-dependent protein
MAAPRKVHTPEALGILNDESLAGAGATTIMRTLAPVLSARLAYFLKALEDAPPDINVLLDLRAKVSTIRQLQRELETTMRRGGEAAGELESLYNVQ